MVSPPESVRRTAALYSQEQDTRLQTRDAKRQLPQRVTILRRRGYGVHVAVTQHRALTPRHADSTLQLGGAPFLLPETRKCAGFLRSTTWTGRRSIPTSCVTSATS